MIGFLTKDNEGYKLHDSFWAFFNENTETWESCNLKKHKNKKPKWYDWSEFELI